MENEVKSSLIQVIENIITKKHQDKKQIKTKSRKKNKLEEIPFVYSKLSGRSQFNRRHYSINDPAKISTFKQNFGHSTSSLGAFLESDYSK